MEQALEADGGALPAGSSTVSRDAMDMPRPAHEAPSGPVVGEPAPGGAKTGGAVTGGAAATIDPPLPGA
jgi:hypothetical protein